MITYRYINPAGLQSGRAAQVYRYPLLPAMGEGTYCYGYWLGRTSPFACLCIEELRPGEAGGCLVAHESLDGVVWMKRNYIFDQALLCGLTGGCCGLSLLLLGTGETLLLRSP